MWRLGRMERDPNPRGPQSAMGRFVPVAER